MYDAEMMFKRKLPQVLKILTFLLVPIGEQWVILNKERYSIQRSCRLYTVPFGGALLAFLQQILVFSSPLP